MEHPLRSGPRVGRRFRGILVTLFAGVLVIAAFSVPFVLRTTASGAHPEAMLPSGSDTAALIAPHRIYVQDGDRIVVLDSDTGRMVHQIPLVDPHANDSGVSLAVDTDATRLFVTEIILDSKNQAVNTLTVYRTSDWSIEQRILVPDITLYLFNAQTSIAASPDGKYLYVYNYSAREQTGLEPVRYWLSILELATWTWLPREVDLQDCGAAGLFPTTPNLLYVLCYGSADVVVDMSQLLAVVSKAGVIPAEPRSGWSMNGVSSATIKNGIMYLVTVNWEIHIKNTTDPKNDRILTGAASVQRMSDHPVAAQRIVRFHPIGLSSDGQYLLVPTATEEERSQGIASEIAMISTESGEVIRTLHPQPFLWITFASDGATAFIVIANPGASTHVGNKLVRLDLASGAETEIFSGAVFRGMVVTP